MAPTIPKDRSRRRAVALQAASGARRTFQITFRESWSWAKTPEAPIRSATTPTTAATRPARGRLAALSTMARTASAPRSPTTPPSAPRISAPPRSPKNRPATPMEMTMRGAIEKTV